jgi:hypothetical protein
VACRSDSQDQKRDLASGDDSDKISYLTPVGRGPSDVDVTPPTCARIHGSAVPSRRRFGRGATCSSSAYRSPARRRMARRCLLAVRMCLVSLYVQGYGEFLPSAIGSVPPTEEEEEEEGGISSGARHVVVSL